MTNENIQTDDALVDRTRARSSTMLARVAGTSARTIGSRLDAHARTFARRAAARSSASGRGGGGGLALEKSSSRARFGSWRSERGTAIPAHARAKTKSAREDDGDAEDEEVLDEDFDAEEEFADADDASEGGMIDDGGEAYGKQALEALREALGTAPFTGEYEVHSFKVNAARRRVQASVDKLSDKYGSPTLDELTAIVRAHNAILEDQGFPEDVAVEIASPGATRTLRVPSELARFRELMMEVTYKGEVENAESTSNVTKVMEITDVNDTEVEWKLADVAANRPGKKGQGMNKKSREWRLRMPVSAVVNASLFIDI